MTHACNASTLEVEIGGLGGKVILGHNVSWRLACAARDPVSKSQTKVGHSGSGFNPRTQKAEAGSSLCFLEANLILHSEFKPLKKIARYFS